MSILLKKTYYIKKRCHLCLRLLGRVKTNQKIREGPKSKIVNIKIAGSDVNKHITAQVLAQHDVFLFESPNNHRFTGVLDYPVCSFEQLYLYKKFMKVPFAHETSLYFSYLNTENTPMVALINVPEDDGELNERFSQSGLIILSTEFSDVKHCLIPTYITRAIIPHIHIFDIFTTSTFILYVTT